MESIGCMTGSALPAPIVAGIFSVLIHSWPCARQIRLDLICVTSFDRVDRPNLSKYGRLFDAFLPISA
jgi:hypothetical protein